MNDNKDWDDGLSKNWLELIKPEKILCEINDTNRNLAKLTIEPLERGYGLTIGNSMRRVLLSSIRGPAITSFKIVGALHQFSSVPGVSEDLLEVIANLKSVVLVMHSDQKRILRLEAVGPCVVTAGMINLSEGVEIINPDLVICHLAQGYNLSMELICEMGKGYLGISEDSVIHEDNEIGVIRVDASFCPIKKVSYDVRPTRIGQMTDYDKLIMHVETKGNISPEIAIGIAAKILQDQLGALIKFDIKEETRSSSNEKEELNPALLQKIDTLELSVRSVNCLKNENIVYVGDLVIRTEAEMTKCPNFGKKSLSELREVLAARGLRFGMMINNWPPQNIEELEKVLAPDK